MTPFVLYGIICMVAGSAILLTSSLIGPSHSGTTKSSHEVATLPKWIGIPAVLLLAIGTGFFIANMIR
ncbi:hypothetical protein GA0061084_2969 [Arthrobacter sp. NIO-1057]|nr:hypothetical protein GA0061084_2969 [Arthrobacter sp. NIO-1057]